MELQKFSGAWPGVGATATGADEYVLSVSGRAFAALCLRGPERGRLSLAVAPEQFVAMTSRPDIVPAHYAARPFWITLTEPERCPREHIEAWVRRSYELVHAGLSRRQQAALAAAESAASKKTVTRKRKS